MKKFLLVFVLITILAAGVYGAAQAATGFVVGLDVGESLRYFDEAGKFHRLTFTSYNGYDCLVDHYRYDIDVTVVHRIPNGYYQPEAYAPGVSWAVPNVSCAPTLVTVWSDSKWLGLDLFIPVVFNGPSMEGDPYPGP